jgi:hypothetical protein
MEHLWSRAEANAGSRRRVPPGEIHSIKRNPPPPIAIRLRQNEMVRRESTVRVRQRALEKPRKSGFSLSTGLAHFQPDAGMERFMELRNFFARGIFSNYVPFPGYHGTRGVQELDRHATASSYS